MAKINKNAIKKDVEKYLKTFAKTYADEASKELTNAASNKIGQYYKDYTPKYYDRTDDLLKNSFSKYTHNNGRKYYGGVLINSEKMQSYHNDKAYTVAFNSWVEGYHGDPTGYGGKFEPIRTTPPLNMLLDTFENKDFRNKIKAIASKKAKSQKYYYLNNFF